MKKEDLKKIKLWRRSGYYSENRLVHLLKQNGYNAMRIPLSNPSMNPIGDVIARRGDHTYAFEVKNGNYAVTIPRNQVIKLFRFLEDFVVSPRKYKHAVLAAHLKKKWKFREVSWRNYDNNRIPDHVTLTRKSRSTWNIRTGIGRYRNV